MMGREFLPFNVHLCAVFVSTSVSEQRLRPTLHIMPTGVLFILFVEEEDGMGSKWE